MSEPFVQEADEAMRYRWHWLVNRCLGDPNYAERLLDPETRARALKDLGLEGDALEKALEALNEVDLTAIQRFSEALGPGIMIPI